MSYCTPCPPCDTEYPLLCEPLETTANGKRLVVEDSAACQKTIQTPVAQQVLKTDGAGNLTWTNGANSTVLGKDSTGKVEFATLNSVLQSGPVDLGSQPLTTTGAVSAGSITSSGDVGIGTTTPTEKLEVIGNIKASGNIQGVEGNFRNIEVGNTSGIAYIDIKSPTSDDYDFRLTTDGTNGIIASIGNINMQPAINKSIIIANISRYANNAAAIAGGLTVNSVYSTTTGELRIVV